MEATIVVVGTFKEDYEHVFADYSQKVRAFLGKQNSVVIRRQSIEQTLYGDTRPSLIMLIDFASAEIARSCFFEQEYLSLIPLRDQVFADFQMYLARYGEI